MVFATFTQLGRTQHTTTILSRATNVMQAHTRNMVTETPNFGFTLKLVRIALPAIIVPHLVWRHKFALQVIISRTLAETQLV